MKNLLSVLALLLVLYNCKEPTNQIQEKSSGLNIEHIDKTINPGNDFYAYANGNWLKTAEMYPGTPFNGNLVELSFRTENQIGEILKQVLNEKDNFPKNSPKGQIQNFYKSYIDTTTRNSLGIKPIQPELDKIFAVKSHSNLFALMGEPLISLFWGEYVFLDSKNTNRYLPIIGQKDLTIGDIAYYLNDTPKNKEIKEKYLLLIEKYFTYAGIDKPKKRAATILDLETKFAQVYWTGTQKRDPNKMYHLMTTEELIAYAPGIDWQAYWNTKGSEGYKELIVHTDTAIQGIAKVIEKTPLEDLKTLLAFYLINNSATYLSQEINDASFDFFSKTLTGVTSQRPLEAKAKTVANKFLNWQLGELYADKYYTPEVEKQAKLLIGYMQKAILKRLQENPWMDDETKKEAIDKFNNINWKIGRPDKTIDQSVLVFEDHDFIGNLRKISAWEAKDNYNRLSEPKREWEWLMPPQIVNAYYQAEMNDVVIPIGILQPPNFDPTADAAANFGGILSIVGHEVGHGFDDKGSKSDAKGFLRNWWTTNSRTDFEKRANNLALQYDQYQPIPGVFLNGKLTLGENIGDLGGVTIAHSAYRDYVNEHQNGKAPVIDGLTGDQRFFIANAQIWSWISTDDYTRMQAVSDNHSPGKFRINGVVRNVDAWYEAFNVKENDSLYLPKDQRVKIW